MNSSIDVPLAYPIAVMAADGSAVKLDSLTLKRPTVKHTRQIALIFGPELARAFFDGDGQDPDVNLGKFVATVVPSLFTAERLDLLSEILADMAGIQTREVDALDVADIWNVLKGVMSFFPALQSIA